MKNNPSACFTIDEVARDVASALGPRRHCIEVVEPFMVQVLRGKTEWERLKIVAAMWRSARQLLQAEIQREHPDWSEEEIGQEAARRMSGGLV